MNVMTNAPLASLTTLRLGGVAARLARVTSEAELIDAVCEVDSQGAPLLLLGGGSNLVIADEGWPGTAVHIGVRGLSFDAGKASSSHVRVQAKAGEPWDGFVAAAVAEGLSGVECLAGIPGLVGAVPMQNVGAYGQDVSETIVNVRVWDRQTRSVAVIDRDGCQFAYRSSMFRGKDRYVILDVTFELEKSADSKPIRYAELARALAVSEGARAPLETTRRTIVELRRKKGMVLDASDPDTTSAGSFFTNPILDREALEAFRERLKRDGEEGERGAVPIFPEPDGRSKLSAGWLIEHAGFRKGFTLPGGTGRAAVSTKHALALTNRGGATTAELLELARAIRDGVKAKFGVTLENEPVFVGVRL